MEQYNVTGMSCAACSARVEKAVSAVEGVTSCSVSLLTNSMGVEGAAKPEEIAAVEALPAAEEPQEVLTDAVAATPEEIADWAYFLTVTNKFCTGQSILVDGGEAINYHFVWKE